MALKLKGSTSGFVAIDAPSVAGNNTLTLPENNGSAQQLLGNDITAGVVTFTSVTVNRNGDLTVPGIISIGGTLTYEDVTSVDSVGIVTARSGVRINGGGLTIIGDTTGLKATGISTLVDVSARNITGVAATFSGSVNATSSVYVQGNPAEVRIQHTGNGSYSRLISDSSNQLNIYTGGGPSLAMIIDGSGNLGQGTGTPTTPDGSNADNSNNGKVFTIYGDSPAINLIHNTSGGSAAADDYSAINFGRNGSSSNPYRAIIGYKQDGDALHINAQGSIKFDVGGNIATGEAMRIVGGKVLMGTTTEGYASADNLTVADSANCGLTLRSGTGSLGTIAFSDATSGSGEYQGYIQYSQDLNYMDFSVDAGSKIALKINAESNATFAGIVTATTFVPTVGQLANRNLIINGAMRVAQRGTTYTGGYGTANSDLYYKTVDRMFVSASNLPNTDVTTSQVALTSGDPYNDGFRYAFQVRMGYQGSVPTNVGVNFVYRMEAQDLACSGWDHKSSSSYITLSFWAKSTVSQTFYGLMRTIDGTNYKYPFSYALTANTWKKVEVTAPGNSNLTLNNDNGEGFRINLAPYLGTDSTSNGVTLNTWSTHSNSAKTPDQTSTWFSTNGATFEVTGLQLEVGQTATPFEHKKFTDELKQCQRYFIRYQGDSGDRIGIGGAAVNTTECRMNAIFPVTMRAVPNILGSGTAQFDAQDDSADFNCNDMTVESAPTGLINSIGIQIVTSGMTGGQAGNFRFRSDGSSLDFGAEL